MAVAYRSSSQAGANAGGTATCTKPAGTVENDFLVGLLSTPNGASNAPTIPTGFSVHPSTIDLDYRLIYKAAGASEPANYQSTAAVLSAVDLSLVCFSGVSLVNPFDQVRGIKTLAGGDIVIPTLTPAGLRFMSHIVKKFANSTFTPPAGVTERYDALSAGVWGGAGGDELVSAATGTRSWDPSSTTTDPAFGYMFTLNAPSDLSGGKGFLGLI